MMTPTITILIAVLSLTLNGLLVLRWSGVRGPRLRLEPILFWMFCFTVVMSLLWTWHSFYRLTTG